MRYRIINQLAFTTALLACILVPILWQNCASGPGLPDDDGLVLHDLGPHSDARNAPLPHGAVARIGLEDFREHHVTALAFSPDDTLLVSGNREGRVILWDTSTGYALKSFEEPDSRISDLFFAPEGEALIAICHHSVLDERGIDDPQHSYSTIELLELKTGLRRIAHQQTGLISAVALSSDGNVLAFSSELEATIHLIDMQTMDLFMDLSVSLTDPDNVVQALAFSPDNRKLAAGSGAVIQLWDVGSGRRLDEHQFEEIEMTFSECWEEYECPPHPCRLEERCREFEVRGPNVVNSLAFSPDGHMLAAGTYDGVVRVFEDGLAEVSWSREQHRWEVSFLSFLPHGLEVISTGLRTAGISGIDDTKERLRFELYEGYGGVAALSRSGRLFATGGNYSIDLHDMHTGQRLRPDLEHPLWIKGVAFGNGDVLVSGGEGGEIQTWDARTGRELAGLTVVGTIARVDTSPNGALIAAAGSVVRPLEEVAPIEDGRTPRRSYDYTIWLIDAVSGDVLREMKVDYVVCALSFSPNSRYLAASDSGSSTVRVWDLSTDETLLLEGHDTSACSLAFSPDSRRLVSGARDGSICLWDLEIGAELLAVDSAEGKAVIGLAFTGNGERMVAVTKDHRISAYDPETGVRLEATQIVLDEPQWDYRPAVFSWDTRLLAIGSDTGPVYVFAVDSGEEVARLLGHRDLIQSLTFSPHDTTLVSVGGGYGLVWNVPADNSY